MFKKQFIRFYQRKIDKVRPAVNIRLHNEIPNPSAAQIAKYVPLVSKVNALEQDLKERPDSYFREKTAQFKERIAEAIASLGDDAEIRKTEETALDDILSEAFALVREAAARTVGMRHFDSQLLGGIVLHKCGIAEMATGEGKTLVATLAAYLNALPGKGVHVVTVNDYLAKRDREWMGPVYEFLGLSVGVIQQNMGYSDRKAAYNCDITYGTNNEFGFDYLRDNMVLRREEMVQRGHFYAIVDEVDSILIDEARTPLIISGPAEESTERYYVAQKVSQSLKGRRILEKDEIEAKHKGVDLGEGFDYLADEKSQTITITDEGLKKCERALGVDNLYDDISNEWPHHLRQALRAKEFFHVEKDYIVKEGKVIIVDEFTGRLMPGRRWSDGLHQAIEAKERLRIQEESQTLATITLQNYFKMHAKLAGMTGTAYTEAAEFSHIYNLDVVAIPTNKPLQRLSFTDQIYKTTKAKFEAVVREIEELSKKGKPLLVGTTSIENSERLSSMLSQKGIPHQVLNAKYHEKEANIVAQAGRPGQITIATNMAGRGTDIILGGNAEFTVKNILKQEGLSPQDEGYQERFKALMQQHGQACRQGHRNVVEVGGLHVIGTERHEARRIDNQLRGRSGRQGDPGSSRFYISLEDDLMRLFGSDKITSLMERFGLPEDQPIEHPLVNRSIEVAQRRVETHNFEIRKQLLDFDNVMNKQREVIYKRRREILDGKSLRQEVMDMCREWLGDSVAFLFSQDASSFEVEKKKFIEELRFRFGIDIDEETLSRPSQESIENTLFERIELKYGEKEKAVGQEKIRFVERMVSLQIIDSRWKEHLLVLDNLREGIHWRSYGQRNPVEEYQQESYQAFLDMLDAIRQGILEMVFRVEVRQPPKLKGVFSQIPQNFVHKEYSSLKQAKAEDAPAAQAQRTLPPEKRVGRNDPCPCGSGKKYKKCCGK